MTRRIPLLQCSVRSSFVIPNVNKSNIWFRICERRLHWLTRQRKCCAHQPAASSQRPPHKKISYTNISIWVYNKNKWMNVKCEAVSPATHPHIHTHTHRHHTHSVPFRTFRLLLIVPVRASAIATCFLWPRHNVRFPFTPNGSPEHRVAPCGRQQKQTTKNISKN